MEPNEVWDAMTEDQRIAATCVILDAAREHAREGGSFRYLIYDRLGLSPAAYVPVYTAGGMAFSNDVVMAYDGSQDADVKAALKVIDDHAMSRPMEPSNIKRADGSPIEVPTAERNAWFEVLWTISAAISAAQVQAEVIRRQRAELAALSTTTAGG